MHGPDKEELVLPGNGDGTFGTAIPTQVGFPGDVAIADVNSDGLPDIGTSQSLSPGNYNISINTTSVDLYFVVAAPAAATAGKSFDITVTARGPDGAILTDYIGTVQFTSTDAEATSRPTTPSPSPMRRAHLQRHASLGLRPLHNYLPETTPPTVWRRSSRWPRTRRSSRLDSADGGRPAGALRHRLDGLRDEFGNLAGGYEGTVHFTSTDPAAILPSDSSLNGGRGTFSVSLVTDAPGRSPPRIKPPASALIPAYHRDRPTASTTSPASADRRRFRGPGLRCWTEAEGWEISTLNADRTVMSADGTTVVADFVVAACRKWTETDGWARSTAANVERVAVSATAPS